MAGTLYIVATPIGNLEDMPPRVAATFGAADFIAAEDTRVTMKLLNYLGLKKPMVSYYEHALQKGEAILQRIEAGESCALCSDAGMPCVSDPGEVIVRDALARGIKVVPIPAASACVTALAVSGQDTSRWVFEGFLPVNRKQKKERLAELLQEKRTVIFYEAPHKLRTTLDDLTAAFGADRSITLCRELTKLHEEIWKTTLGEAVEHYRAAEPRGEYVLVMAGAPAAEPTELTLDEAAQRVLNELTGLKNVNLMQFKAFGSKNRTKDPRDVHWLERAMQSKVERIVTIAYLSLVKIDRTLNRGLDEYMANWVALPDIKALAFDHNLIIKEAITYIRQYIEFNPSSLFDLLPRKFTASQLRTLYELLYGKQIDVRNFHKKIALMEYVVPLEEKQQGVAHRAARYYRFDKKIYNKVRR